MFGKKVDAELIRRAIYEFDWITALSIVIEDTNVSCVTKTLLHILHNFIPYETLLVMTDTHL